MVAKTHRFEVIQRLMQLQNDSFWKELEVLVNKAEEAEIAATKQFKPLTEAEFLAEIREARAEAKMGKVTSIEALMKEAENW